jgi:hypothetical protein
MNCEKTKDRVIPTTTLLFWGGLLRLLFLMWFRFMAATRHCRWSADYDGLLAFGSPCGSVGDGLLAFGSPCGSVGDGLLAFGTPCGSVGKGGLFPRPPHELGAWEIFGPYTFSNKILLTCFKICNTCKEV